MTRTDLIRKIIRFVGIPEQEAKVFMEAFLRRLSETLSVDDIFKIDGVGAFKIKNLQSSLTHPSNLKSNVIVFNDDFFFGEGGTELIFGIPESKQIKPSELDSVFSLSIGKPVIPLRIQDRGDLYTLYSGSEINFIIDSKVEKLFVNFSSNKSSGVEEKLVDSISDDERRTTDSNSEDSQIKLFSETDFTNSISWDFGQTWQEEFEENEILESEPEPSELNLNELAKVDESDLNQIFSSWDFGQKKNEIKEDDIITATIDRQPSIEDEDAIDDEEFEEPLTPTQEFWRSIDEEVVEEIINSQNNEDDYRPVKSRTQELNIDLSGLDLSEYDEPEQLSEEANDAWKRLTNEIEDDNFIEVKKTGESRFFLEQYYDNQQRSAEEEEIAAILEAHKKETEGDPTVQKTPVSRFEVYSLFNEIKPEPDTELEEYAKPNSYTPSPHPDFAKGSAKAIDKVEEDFEDDDEVLEELSQPKKKRFVLNLSIIIIIISASAFLYTKFYGIPRWLGLEKISIIEKAEIKSNPVVIDRDYELPINYPYPSRNLTADNSVVNKSESSNQTQEIHLPANFDKPETESSEIFSKNNPGNVLNQKVNNPTSQTSQKEVKAAEPKETKPQPIPTPTEKTNVNEKKISENIYQDGNSYSVQVSSWKSKPRAQAEVARFLKAGRQAVLVEVEIPGRGIWYRVRIKGFASTQEAERFISQNR